MQNQKFTHQLCLPLVRQGLVSSSRWPQLVWRILCPPGPSRHYIECEPWSWKTWKFVYMNLLECHNLGRPTTCLLHFSNKCSSTVEALATKNTSSRQVSTTWQQEWKITKSFNPTRLKSHYVSNWKHLYQCPNHLHDAHICLNNIDIKSSLAEY